MTAQIHELLIYEGEKTSMAFCPPLPKKHPRIIELDSDHIKKDKNSSIFFSTACWRGYQGIWEIKDGRFYLIALRGRVKLRGKKPILADWFSGVLRIPKGEMLQYVHMGFESIFEQEVHVKVKNGVVVSSRVIDNRSKAR